jgi:hypothetical protein
MTVPGESAISDTSLSRVDLPGSGFVSRELCARSVFVGTDWMAAFGLRSVPGKTCSPGWVTSAAIGTVMTATRMTQM